MASNSPTHRLTPSTLEYDTEDHGNHTPSQPLSGPGSTRQTRRLQLRNAGFRGPAIPARKVTPKTVVPSSNWSTVSGIQGSSDVENVSPSGRRKSSPTEQRWSGGILKEIGNSTLTRPKKSRPRLSSGKFFAPDNPSDEGPHTGTPMSPPQSKTTIRPRSVKPRAKVSHGRRSVSAETSKYIEHLEVELAAAQSQLSSITSPSVTRVQTSKMRTLNAETRQLQEELAEWESKYELRVQEEVDKHCAIESALHARIRSLEQDVEEAKFKAQELEMQLASATQNVEAVDAANLDLERRIEIMSEILATSAKIDLHAETPGRAKRHTRPKSMLPRFPTASSLMGSPERQPRTQPASPMLSFTNRSPGVSDSPNHSISPLDASSQESDYMSEAESIFSEASVTGGSVTSAENFDLQPSYNPWSLPIVPNNRAKPARRMRRFGAGSLGPKPLILPTTSKCEGFQLGSAPALERSETTPAFFPVLPKSSEDYRNPLSGRRRASTVPSESAVANLEPSPFLDLRQSSVEEDTVVNFSSPSSAESHVETHPFSSLGLASGRNLMEELVAVRSAGTNETTEPTSEAHEITQEDFPDARSQIVPYDPGEEHQNVPDAAQDIELLSESLVSDEAASSVTTRQHHHRMRSRSTDVPVVGYATSAFDRLRMLFGDLWRSPVALARHLVQTAQAKMRIPQPLLSVQWWLVGVLLGPMARRRMLMRNASCDDLEDQALLLSSSPDDGKQGNAMAYGTLYENSPRSINHTSNTRSGSSKRRAASRVRCSNHRRKHSPWLWIKFSITLAFAIGSAFKDGPGTLLKTTACSCRRRHAPSPERLEARPDETPCR